MLRDRLTGVAFRLIEELQPEVGSELDWTEPQSEPRRGGVDRRERAAPREIEIEIASAELDGS